jgi:hypothetical protein
MQKQRLQKRERRHLRCKRSCVPAVLHIACCIQQDGWLPRAPGGRRRNFPTPRICVAGRGGGRRRRLAGLVTRRRKGALALHLSHLETTSGAAASYVEEGEVTVQDLDPSAAPPPGESSPLPPNRAGKGRGEARAKRESGAGGPPTAAAAPPPCSRSSARHSCSWSPGAQSVTRYAPTGRLPSYFKMTAGLGVGGGGGGQRGRGGRICQRRCGGEPRSDVGPGRRLARSILLAARPSASFLLAAVVGGDSGRRGAGAKQRVRAVATVDR